MKALPDSILTVCAVLRLRVDEGADGSDVVRRLEPAVAVSRGYGRFVDVGGQEEDDDVETGFESVFLYPNSNAPVWSKLRSKMYARKRRAYQSSKPVLVLLGALDGREPIGRVRGQFCR